VRYKNIDGKKQREKENDNKTSLQKYPSINVTACYSSVLFGQYSTKPKERCGPTECIKLRQEGQRSGRSTPLDKREDYLAGRSAPLDKREDYLAGKSAPLDKRKD
jgi:hypothetical protein